ncbi:TetR/AcrR family transcriptional regulator [Mumia zhuanghuii]|uniref:TetR/AcrR family transcriptional regulator n=2 Tax=Mumia TaxID=1546255 RepID=A0ABW1QFH8_9ACTN|nr:MULTISPECIES: TetR/AcrR family transcriptional regulator [Mumia]KAA1424544.1 TetR/AcrR family transcriptional regulator [Mumia zhuanghuii]
MPRAAHRPSQRDALLDSALDLIRGGEALSLDSAARAAGVTKPGLMYHFPTKEALVTALVDHLLDSFERDLEALVPAGTAAPAHERLAAYARWALAHEHDAADLAMLSDPRLRVAMCARWTTRFRAWVEVPDDLPAPQRGRLNAVRLLADGCWYADAMDVLPLVGRDRDAVLAAALDLLESTGA